MSVCARRHVSVTHDVMSVCARRHVSVCTVGGQGGEKADAIASSFPSVCPLVAVFAEDVPLCCCRHVQHTLISRDITWHAILHDTAYCMTRHGILHDMAYCMTWHAILHDMAYCMTRHAILHGMTRCMYGCSRKYRQKLMDSFGADILEADRWSGARGACVCMLCMCLCYVCMYACMYTCKPITIFTMDILYISLYV